MFADGKPGLFFYKSSLFGCVMVQHKKELELLAPAKDLECGIAAIDNGADAVYIGAEKFGARKEAGNTIHNISKLVEYAHLFRVKVYVAINTLIFDHEIKEVEKLIWDIYNTGADAIIIQDMGILQLNLPPIPLHASTQTDNRTPAKVKFLEDTGFQQVVLARELTINQIKEIRNSSTIPLEFFVHGALCVSYSGNCYMSYLSSGRSANRGECSQPCRLKYSLVSPKGVLIEKYKHLLSLKDLNLSEKINDLIDAGITSFKIEGRLKDPGYIKNITAFYRKTIDEIINKRTEFIRSSSGQFNTYFQPAPIKSFSRGFSTYFLDGRQKGIWSMFTPKSIGEKIGKVIKVGKDHFLVQTNFKLNNGDGLCFFDRNMNLTGVKVDISDGNKIFVSDLSGIFSGATIYRNYDHGFNKELENKPSKRKIAIRIIFSETNEGIKCQLIDEDGIKSTVDLSLEKEIAQKPDKALEQIKTQLTKWGNSPFVVQNIRIELDNALFIPLSVLNGLRRTLGESHIKQRINSYKRIEIKIEPTTHPYPYHLSSFESNVTNRLAGEFYNNHGIKDIIPGLEISLSMGNEKVMTTKHCIRYSSDLCPLENSGTKPEDMVLKSNKNSYLLKFNCQKCEMEIYAIQKM